MQNRAFWLDFTLILKAPLLFFDYDVMRLLCCAVIYGVISVILIVLGGISFVVLRFVFLLLLLSVSELVVLRHKKPSFVLVAPILCYATFQLLKIMSQ